MKTLSFVTFCVLSLVCVFNSPVNAQQKPDMPSMSKMQDSMATAMDSTMDSAMDAAMDSTMGHALEAVLSGENAVPSKGDPDGSGKAMFTFRPDSAEVCYSLTVKNIAKAGAAHIHHAPAGKNGPAVVPLEAPASGSSKGCVHELSADLIKDILKSPGDYYVNVHNADYPGGAVRGQLTMPMMMGK